MRRLIPCLLLLLPAFAAAESPWRLGVAMGYGERSNPLLNSDDLPIILDLDIAYFGEHFFFDNGDVGLTFADNDVGQALETPAEIIVPDRDYAAEAGVEFLSDGRWGFVQVNAFHDISGTHDGYEFDVDYGIGFRAGP
jgi:hypothetical protein